MDAFFGSLPIYVNVLVVLASLFLLVKSGGYMIDGAVGFARKARISPLIIGSTIIAMGTSMAELSVNLVATVNGGNTGVILGNILGSNLVNIGIALGIPAVITIIATITVVVEKELLLYFAINGLLTIFAVDGVLSRNEGIVLVSSFILILFLIYQYAMRERKTELVKKELKEEHTMFKSLSTKTSIFYLIGGLVVLMVSAQFLISSASSVARFFHVSDYIIGLTIIGVGTSFPEIVASIQAARKGYTDIVLGNVFGSNIFNICFGLGLPMLVRNIPIDKSAMSDLYFINLYGVGLVFLLLLENKVLGKNKTIARGGGILVTAGYVIYILVKVMNPS